MAELKEKIAYIQGLADGLDLDDKSAEGKILRHVLEVLEDMADIIEDIDLGQAELEDYVEAIDEDLAELEKDFLESEVAECQCDCDDHCSDDDLDDLDDVDVEELDDDEVEVECPHCGEVAYVEEEDLADEELEILCPNCGKVLFESTENDDDDEL
ncbi:hypothetical protein SAMN02745227_00409 [Anaerobranca californiensis DSM 14826]|jgi:predicted RNA-binding Zn-ribbon protein involved in translation (DUF1610 family)|uniref:TFIIB-type domain-containing protein n=1 Tax=Anaerobranca californiensis DSM 14826 TaxID=1120989 RepID=A0A1M6L817_9FIRM|nr:CD1247 N-terminal domain-containing protein [Anaerobranca californiensis]SHJ67315.1 hypothetical protein SAMN02745227_00409 [Anaerobranca californiensis DSM 14826]